MTHEQHRSQSMQLCYSDFRRFDDKLDLIVALVRKDARNEAEIAALRKEIADLLAGDAEMAKKVDAAFTKSQAAEDKLRSAIPQ
jgi:hypothetical protein